MSQENVEAVKRGVAAWNADDLDGYLAEADPDVEYYPSIEPGLEGKAAVWRGHDALRKAWKEYRSEAWSRLTIRPQEFRDLGESVLMLSQFDLTARTTGIEFSHEGASLLEFRGGKVVRVRDFLTHAEALEAAGLSE